MAEPNELSITIVGVTTVFIVFVILYIVFKIFEYLGVSKGKKVRLPKSEEGIKTPDIGGKSVERFENESKTSIQTSSEDEEIAAVIAVVYAYIGTNVRVRAVKRVLRPQNRGVKGLRDWQEWRNYGWRGGNRL